MKDTDLKEMLNNRLVLKNTKLAPLKPKASDHFGDTMNLKLSESQIRRVLVPKNQPNEKAKTQRSTQLEPLHKTIIKDKLERKV